MHYLSFGFLVSLCAGVTVGVLCLHKLWCRLAPVSCRRRGCDQLMPCVSVLVMSWHGKTWHGGAAGHYYSAGISSFGRCPILKPLFVCIFLILKCYMHTY